MLTELVEKGPAVRFRLGQVREFRVQDLDSVANLWMKVFRRLDSPSPASLRNYFAEIFLDDPCVSSGDQFLVYEEREQGIVCRWNLSRPMMFQKQPVPPL